MKTSRISNSSNGTRAQDEGEEFRKENKKFSRGEQRRNCQASGGRSKGSIGSESRCQKYESEEESR